MGMLYKILNDKTYNYMVVLMKITSTPAKSYHEEFICANQHNISKKRKKIFPNLFPFQKKVLPLRLFFWKEK